MPRSALLTSLIPDDANPMGTDFVGGAHAASRQAGSAWPGRPGSDFAGDATPLTAEATEEHAA